jgi:hypothetical protein
MYTIFITHLVVTLCMIGIMWFVQLVSYPFLGCIESLSPANNNSIFFAACERWYVRCMTMVISPPMFLELVTGWWLLWQKIPTISSWIVRLNVLLLVVIWLSSLCVQVPMHCRLAKGFDKNVYRLLVRTNWIRTAVWTVRGCLLIMVLFRLLQ